MSIGKNISILRHRYNLSQDELAQIAGVTNKAVSAWESNKKTPRMGVIQRIADHFGLKKSDIIEDDGLERTSVVRSVEESIPSPEMKKLENGYRLLDSVGRVTLMRVTLMRVLDSLVSTNTRRIHS